MAKLRFKRKHRASKGYQTVIPPPPAAVVRAAYNRATLALRRTRAIETKFQFGAAGEATCDFSTGIVVPLTDIDQGVTEATRVGNQITVKSVKFQAWMRVNQTSTLNNNVVRVFLVRDAMSLGTVPSVANVLESTGSLLSVVSNYSGNNYYDNPRFKIHYDKCFNLSLYQTGGLALVKKTVRINKKVSYTSALGTDEGKNQLYLMFISSINVNDPLVAYTFMTRYTDQ